MRTHDMRGFKLRFADFECVLLRLGFQRKPTHADRMLYQHTNEADTSIILPAYTPDAQVRPVDFVSARFFIDQRGLLDERDFDRMIADAASESDADCLPVEPQTLAAP